jgi:hypothetical protein
VPFAQFLFGGANGGIGVVGGQSRTPLHWPRVGGVDVVLTKNCGVAVCAD